MHFELRLRLICMRSRASARCAITPSFTAEPPGCRPVTFACRRRYFLPALSLAYAFFIFIEFDYATDACYFRDYALFSAFIFLLSLTRLLLLLSDAYPCHAFRHASFSFLSSSAACCFHACIFAFDSCAYADMACLIWYTHYVAFAADSFYAFVFIFLRLRFNASAHIFLRAFQAMHCYRLRRGA